MPHLRGRTAALMVLLTVASGCGSTLGPRSEVEVPRADVAVDDGEGPEVAASEEPTPTPTPAASPAEEQPSEEPVTQDEAEEVDGGDDGGAMLSSCTPATDGTELVVAPTGPRPDVGRMEASLESNPDLRAFLEGLVEQGVGRPDALHDVYAQVVGDAFIAHARELPGYVTAAYASPLEGRTFRLAFDGPVPDDLDTTSYELGSYGLEVTTGVPGRHEELGRAGYVAAEEVGIRVVGGSYDAFTGTARIDVIDASREQVAAWEARLDDPSRWCMVRVEPDTRCDEDVVEAARDEAERQGEVTPGGTESPEAAEAVRRSHLGLTLDESRDKAGREDRAWRVVTEDGVGLSGTSDLQPGRLNVTSCLGVVVDAEVEGVADG